MTESSETVGQLFKVQNNDAPCYQQICWVLFPVPLPDSEVHRIYFSRVVIITTGAPAWVGSLLSVDQDFERGQR